MCVHVRACACMCVYERERGQVRCEGRWSPIELRGKVRVTAALPKISTFMGYFRTSSSRANPYRFQPIAPDAFWARRCRIHSRPCSSSYTGPPNPACIKHREAGEDNKSLERFVRAETRYQTWRPTPFDLVVALKSCVPVRGFSVCSRRCLSLKPLDSILPIYDVVNCCSVPATFVAYFHHCLSIFKQEVVLTKTTFLIVRNTR